MENLTVVELKKQCKSLNISLTKSNGSPKLKKDLIKSLTSVNQQSSIVGGKRRSRKNSKKLSRRRSRKNSIRRNSIKKKSSRRRSRKVSRRRKNSKQKCSRRKRRSVKQVGGANTFYPWPNLTDKLVLKYTPTDKDNSLLHTYTDKTRKHIAKTINPFEFTEVYTLRRDISSNPVWERKTHPFNCYIYHYGGFVHICQVKGDIIKHLRKDHFDSRYKLGGFQCFSYALNERVFQRNNKEQFDIVNAKENPQQNLDDFITRKDIEWQYYSVYDDTMTTQKAEINIMKMPHKYVELWPFAQNWGVVKIKSIGNPFNRKNELDSDPDSDADAAADADSDSDSDSVADAAKDKAKADKAKADKDKADKANKLYKQFIGMYPHEMDIGPTNHKLWKHETGDFYIYYNERHVYICKLPSTIIKVLKNAAKWTKRTKWIRAKSDEKRNDAMDAKMSPYIADEKLSGIKSYNMLFLSDKPLIEKISSIQKWEMYLDGDELPKLITDFNILTQHPTQSSTLVFNMPKI